MSRRQTLNVGVCPFCASGRIYVTSTCKPRRFFKCKVCKKSWKCLEIIERPFWLSDVLVELLAEGRLNEYDFGAKKLITAICNKNHTDV